MSLTFTQGFLLGQLSVIIFLGCFIKYFIFGEAPTPPSRSSRHNGTRTPSSSSPDRTTGANKHLRTTSLHGIPSSKSPAQAQSLRNKASASNVLRPMPTNATDIASILRRTYYTMPNRGGGNSSKTHDATSHQPESLDWFNVLLAQTIAQYRQTAYNLRDGTGGTPTILASLENAINDPGKRPSYIDKIRITEISMGEEFPIFSNVRVMALEDEGGSASATGGRLQALMDVDLSDDNLTLAIETALILNYPKPFSAVLPVALAVSVVRFSGTLSISFVPATEDDTSETHQSTSGKPKTNLAFSFLPDYRLDLSVRSLIGSRTRLQDVPKIAQLVEARAQAWFEERVVEPRVQVVPLPGLWPRMGKTRVREGQEDDRPPTQDGHRPPSFVDHRKDIPPIDNFPSQEEAERLVQGLRLRTGYQRSNSQVFEHETDVPTPQTVRVMPGSLPA